MSKGEHIVNMLEFSGDIPTNIRNTCCQVRTTYIINMDADKNLRGANWEHRSKPLKT
jgi:hypothetical protein